MSRLLPAVLDVLLVVVFAAVGRRSHAEGLDVADFFSRTAVRIVLVVLLLLILAFLFLRGNGRGRRYGKRSSGRAAPAGYRGRRR